MMGIERVAENKIRQAMDDGQFDGVADGRPLDLEEYFSLPEGLRMAYSVLKSAGYVPMEVEYLREVDRLRRSIDAAPDDSERETLRQALRAVELRLNLALERARRPTR
jgi:hypothetical protein